MMMIMAHHLFMTGMINQKGRIFSAEVGEGNVYVRVMREMKEGTIYPIKDCLSLILYNSLTLSFDLILSSSLLSFLQDRE